MNKILFEDNPDNCISLLLKKCYNDENLYFYSGNGNAIKYLSKIYTTTDTFYIYMTI